MIEAQVHEFSVMADYSSQIANLSSRRNMRNDKFPGFEDNPSYGY
jgi:hypothetical protein